MGAIFWLAGMKGVKKSILLQDFMLSFPVLVIMKHLHAISEIQALGNSILL